MTEEIGPYKIIGSNKLKICRYKSKLNIAPSCGCQVKLPDNQEIICIQHARVDKSRNKHVRQQIWIPAEELQDLRKVLSDLKQYKSRAGIA